MLDHIVALKTNLQEDDLTTWQWLQALIKALGESGMSSKESSVENGVENVLRVKNMEWRRNILQRIINSDIFFQRGSQPLIRKRAHGNPTTTRKALTGLPLALYDGAWMANLTERQLEALKISQEPFSWVQVIVA